MNSVYKLVIFQTLH